MRTSHTNTHAAHTPAKFYTHARKILHTRSRAIFSFCCYGLRRPPQPPQPQARLRRKPARRVRRLATAGRYASRLCRPAVRASLPGLCAGGLCPLFPFRGISLARSLRGLRPLSRSAEPRGPLRSLATLRCRPPRPNAHRAIWLSAK